MPIPPPISSHSFRCLGLALNRRGNHTNGTDTVRPSSRVTVSSWFVHDTSTARTSLLSAKVGIPPLQEPISILQNQVSNHRYLVTPKSTVRRQSNFNKPSRRSNSSSRYPVSLCYPNDQS